MLRICVVASRDCIQTLKYLLSTFPELRPRDIELVFIESRKASHFLTKRDVEELLSRASPDIDLVVVPSTVCSQVEEIAGRRVIPLKHCADVIPLLHFLVDGVDLTGKSIVEIETQLLSYKKMCEDVVYSAKNRVARPRGFLGKHSARRCLTGMPPILMAEIIDATLLGTDEFMRRVEHYVSEGADGIDIGCVVGEPRPDRVRELAALVKREYPDVLVSVDTFSQQEISAALDKIDLILSMTLPQLSETSLDLTDTGVVVIPDKVYSDEELVDYFRRSLQIGEKKRAVVIADPLLRPPLFGLAESIHMLYMLRRRLPELPLFAGLGNVTELVDADSPGMNALLAVIMLELGVDVVLTTEASVKTQGCVSELRRALQMMTCAKILRKYPKDMSVHMLYLKRKY